MTGISGKYSAFCALWKARFIDFCQSIRSTTVIVLLGLYILVFGGLAFFFIKDSIKSSFNLWRTTAARKSLEKVLNLSKPWHVAEDKWKTVHADVIRENVKDEYLYSGREIANSAAYRILCTERPDHLDSSDWNEVIILAVDRLEKSCSEMARGYTESQVMRFLRLEKPKYFPKDKWDDLSEKANRNFVGLRKQTYLELDGLLGALKEKKPAEISEASWTEVVRDLQQQYYDRVMEELKTSDAPLEVVGKHDLSVLDEKQRQDPERWASGKAKYEELTRLFDALIDEKPLSASKPELLSDWEWFRFQRFKEKLETLSDVETKAEEIKAESSRIAGEREQVVSLKQRLERQLNIIHELLNDPSTIDRIESYNDTFAPGNLENLRKVASILKVASDRDEV